MHIYPIDVHLDPHKTLWTNWQNWIWTWCHYKPSHLHSL